MANNDYYTYVHQRSEVRTVGDFCNQQGVSIAFYYQKKELELLNYKGDTNRTNWQRIADKYTLAQRESNKGKAAADVDINVNTRILIPLQHLNREVMVLEGNQVVETESYEMFMADKLAELIKDTRKWPVFHNTPSNGEYQIMHTQLSVWMWCRALSNPQDKDMNGAWVDVSPFIQAITSTVGARGGNFNLTLTPLICEPDPVRGWVIKRSTIDNYYNTTQAGSYVAKSQLHTHDKEQKLKRNQFFFHNIISKNDLIFIRYEQLSSEAERVTSSQPFALSSQDIPGKETEEHVYDMIGLVDDNAFTFNAQSFESGITISGRDLTKAVLDDGCYFYPLEFAGKMFVNNSREPSDFVNRIFGKVEELAVYVQRPLDYSVKYILTKLAQLSVVPDELFSYYPESQRARHLDENGHPVRYKGIWQITKLLFDQRIANRRICDSSISTESGAIINYLDKLCQAPFVEFYTDTIGNSFYYIFRQPPFTQESILSAVNGLRAESSNTFSGTLVLTVEEKDVLSEQLSWNSSEIYSWYKINPQALFFGEGQSVSLAYLPAIYFEEYAKVYGSLPLDVTSNYVPYAPITGDKTSLATGYLERQAFRDLKFMIDTHAYMPFVRMGTMTLNGDRRIKRGMWIRYQPTGELFYVDSVTHNLTVGEVIDRTTVLSVSRGMVERYVEGQYHEGKLYSYFNIINTELKEEFFQHSGDSSYVNVLTDWRVDRDVFNFFLRRDQLKGKTLSIGDLPSSLPTA